MSNQNPGQNNDQQNPRREDPINRPNQNPQDKEKNRQNPEDTKNKNW